jgi:hypothetical protein
MIEKIKEQIPVIINFVKKHRLIISIPTLAIIIFIALFYFVPVIGINNVKLVNLGTSVRIQKNQIAELKGTGVSAKIQYFVNESCPKAGTCFGTDVIHGVAYDLTIDDTKYTDYSYSDASSAPYQVKTIKSDYKTYADIKIVKSK